MNMTLNWPAESETWVSKEIGCLKTCAAASVAGPVRTCYCSGGLSLVAVKPARCTAVRLSATLANTVVWRCWSTVGETPLTISQSVFTQAGPWQYVVLNQENDTLTAMTCRLSRRQTPTRASDSPRVHDVIADGRKEGTAYQSASKETSTETNNGLYTRTNIDRHEPEELSG
ncbi:hypothetical protein BR93DRAFT_679945 [Coniochaeta sp. PMI_546]|nr:hypothetical protein BR93DRAFT_679945 [Coniochaeta sp. PMI_546]